MVIMPTFDTGGKGKQKTHTNKVSVHDRSYGTGAHLLTPGPKGNKKPMTGSEWEGEETNGLYVHLFFQVRSVSPDRKRDWETMGFLSIFYAIFLEKDAHNWRKNLGGRE
jgi:hypothetical protein